VKEYVLDANAVLRYFSIGEAAGGDKVRKLFEQAERGEAKLSICVINLGEVHYILLKRIGEQRALPYIRALELTTTIFDADLDRTIRAATLKHKHKLGYADSFAAALALERDAMLVSADPSFENVGRSLKWMKLPRFEAKQR
jgi:tRNA(fMet)-specific endonuclease VapC